jgi:hypothetical protein
MGLLANRTPAATHHRRHPFPHLTLPVTEALIPNRQGGVHGRAPTTDREMIFLRTRKVGPQVLSHRLAKHKRAATQRRRANDQGYPDGGVSITEKGRLGGGGGIRCQSPNSPPPRFPSPSQRRAGKGARCERAACSSTWVWSHHHQTGPEFPLIWTQLHTHLHTHAHMHNTLLHRLFSPCPSRSLCCIA